MEFRGSSLAQPGERPEESCHTGVLAASHLVRRFGGRTAVDDVTFEVNACEVFGMLGGLIPPTSGEVRVDGIAIDRASRSRLRARIGFLAETPMRLLVAVALAAL